MIRGRFNKNKNRFLGFSIVEMSVVLSSVAAVIVLTAGGVTMVNKSKLGKITTDISDFRTAIEKFENEYGSLPGDMADVSSLPGAVTGGGNGNGAIDSANEAMYLWEHLAVSGLLEGKYDGVSSFEPGIGVPASKMDSSGYNVKFPLPAALPEQALVVEFAGFSTAPNSNAMPILTPEDAMAIDEKADDGNPLTGEIFAEEMIVGDCISGGAYNVSNHSSACRLLFVIKSGGAADDAPAVTGACTQLGQSRQRSDSSQHCPAGYIGKVVETCRIDSGNTGTWEITDRNCALIECSGGGLYGDTRRLSCINNMVASTNKGIVQECTDAGVWKVKDTDCVVETKISCQTNGNLRVAQACDWGEQGYSLQTCTNNVWGPPSPDICTKIQCGGSTDIGDSDDLTGCGDSDYDGDAKRVCTIEGTWEPTSIGSSCVPSYSGGCTAGTTPNKEIGCPHGKTGEHWLTCVDATTDYWTTLVDNCVPIKCDGKENVGAVRVKEGALCPNGLNGTVMEYCRDDGSGNGIWQEVATNCVANICDSTGDLLGNAYWPATVANGTGTATACAEGYEWSTAPTRQCDNTGTWAASTTGECVRKRCDDASPDHNNASYKDALPLAGNYDLEGNCKSGYSGDPLIDCSIEGEWENERLPCTLDIPGGFVMWFDTDDEESVWQNENCNDPATGVKTVPGGAGATGKVGCLMDRSGNGNNAVQSNPSLRPALTDAASGQNGLSTMLFSNSSPSHLRYPDIGEFDENTVFAAHNRIGSDFSMMMLGSESDSSKSASWYYSSIQFKIRYYVYDQDPRPYSNTIVPDSQYMVNSLSDDGVNINFYKNGVSDGSASIVTSTKKNWGPGGIGDWLYDNSYPYNGKISEILLYDRALTADERDDVEQYLGDKWGVTIP